MAKEQEVISNDPAEDIAPISPYGAVEYTSDPETLADLVKQSTGIKEITSAKDVAAVKPFIGRLRALRLDIDKERVALKEGVLTHGRLVDSEAKILVDIIKPEEERLQAIRKTFEEAAAKVKADKLEAEAARKKVHTDKIQEISDCPGNMIKREAGPNEMARMIADFLETDVESFEEFKDQAQGALATAVAVLGMAVKLAEDKAKQDETEKKQREAEEKISAERMRIEEVSRANTEEADRLKQLEADQTKAAEKAELAKKAADLAEEQRLANIEKSRPDSEILIKFVHVLRSLPIPALNTNQGVVTWIEQDIETLATKIIDTANGMIS